LPAQFPPSLNSLSHKIIGAAFEVLTQLGPALREKIYEEALVSELRSAGLGVEQQLLVRAAYRGRALPIQTIDLVVERSIVLGVRSVRALTDTNHAQVLGHITFARLPLGLLMNFACPHLRDGIYRKINFPMHTSPLVEVLGLQASPSSSASSVLPL
jgi:GxxExxY protein